jgi:eukaryotic-like serine/threonine-protein kinase
VSHESIAVDDRYELGGKLGEGRCGDVYRAWDRLDRRSVALKWARADPIDSSELLENNSRVVRERELLRSLSSPDVVRVLGSGCHDGREFMVMEIATGGTLGARLSAGRRGDAWSIACLARAVADGLDEIHSRGFVHRDIEPGNLLISHGVDDPVQLLHTDQERVLIADLGIAVRSTDGCNGQDPKRGTRLYRAPEQSARAETVGLTADVYGATAVVVTTLTGLLPPPPDGLDELLRHLKPRWQEFVSTGMNRSPGRRFSTMSDWKSALFDAVNLDLLEAGLDEFAP